MPTESRTRPGVTRWQPVRRRSADWCVVDAGWMTSAHVADVGDVAVQGEGVHEPLARPDTALDLEG